jgi:cytochrome bd-type quinol oxidase subunit 2
VSGNVSHSGAWGLARAGLTGLAAFVLSAAAVLYATIAFDTSSPPGMEVRTRLVWAVLVLSVASTWILAFRKEDQSSRLVTGFASGFNCVWLVSFVGLPVVAASLLACLPQPSSSRRRVPVVIALAALGLAVGLVMVRLTEPPGEHIFG